MCEELDALNDKLKEIAGYGKLDERIFNIGIELGRVLERTKVENYRPPFFVAQEEMLNVREEKAKRIEAVNELIHKLICWAHKEQIREHSGIQYETGWRAANSPFSDEVKTKYCIQYSRIDQVNVGGDFDIYFTATGKLKAIFDKHKINPQIETTLSNGSGEEDEYIASEENAEQSLYGSRISINSHNEQLSLAQINSFADEIEKYFTFFVLKQT
jgi:hypothetical protein